VDGDRELAEGVSMRACENAFGTTTECSTEESWEENGGSSS
jgi:hypothetical protein